LTASSWRGPKKKRASTAHGMPNPNLSLYVWGLPWFFLFLASPLNASFLDESRPLAPRRWGGIRSPLPWRRLSLGQPAGLGWTDHYGATARYQRLMEGLEDDDHGAGSVAILGPVGRWGGWGASWDHFGADISSATASASPEVAFSPFPRGSEGRARLIPLALSQRFTLSEALQSVSPSDLSSTAFSFGAGLRFQPHARSRSASRRGPHSPQPRGDRVDRAEAVLRLGVCLYEFPRVGPGPFLLTLGAHRADSAWRRKAGRNGPTPPRVFPCEEAIAAVKPPRALVSREALHPGLRLCLLDGEAASLGGTGLPANHLFELMWGWGGRFTPEDPDGYAALMRKAARMRKPGDGTRLSGLSPSVGKTRGGPSTKRGWERVLAATTTSGRSNT
jgi:hypothetical protein